MVSTRHDLVHRNGKTKEGDKVIISIETIENLITAVTIFVKDIAVKLDLDITGDINPLVSVTDKSEVIC